MPQLCDALAAMLTATFDHAVCRCYSLAPELARAFNMNLNSLSHMWTRSSAREQQEEHARDEQAHQCVSTRSHVEPAVAHSE